jgi:PAS domain S-box-containing protein
MGVYFDLTKEKSFQQILSLEKEKLELLTQNSPDIIILMDEHKKIEYISPTAERLLGYTEKEMLGKKFDKFICAECINYLEKSFWLKKAGSINSHFEYRMIKKNGEMIWVESAISLVKNQGNGEQKYLMHNRDIHSIKAAEDLLKEREQKYRGLFENMDLGVMEVDLQDKIQWVNKSFEKMTGYSFSYLKGKNAFKTFISSTVAKAQMDNVNEKRREKKDSIYEVKMRVKDGEMKDVVISGSPIIDLNGKVKGSVGIHWDVTNIKKMESIIEEEKLSRQKDVMKATLNAEEQQRLIIGNELHDGVGHTLTYTSLFLQMAANEKNITPEIIRKAKEKVDEALKEIKRISTNLVPPALIDLGFKEAIVELFNQYAKVNKITFKISCRDTDFLNVNLNAQRNIYRIIQELLNNTVKHSKADTVNLNIKKTRHSMELVFFNNGNAFNPLKVKRGLGLNSIHNRTYFYNGKIVIESNKNKGTFFNISIPIKNIVNHG